MATKTTFERYHQNPLKYAQDMLSDANMIFEGLRSRIQRNMRHYVFESSHIDRRRSERLFHSGKYFPYLNPAIQSLGDAFMQAWQQGDPPIRGTAFYPKNLDTETSKFLDDSANRLEDYANVWVRPDIQDPMISFDHQLDLWFITLCMFPYSVMRLQMAHKYEYVNFSRVVADGFDELNLPRTRKEFARRRVMVMPYPQYVHKMPDSCRVDLQNSSAQWRFFFDFEDLTPDELMADAEARGYPRRQIRAILKTSPSDTILNAQRLNYGTLSVDMTHQDIDTYRKVTGFIRVFNSESGYVEIRKVVFIEGADDKNALLEEALYEYSYENAPYFLSFNYVLPGERYGQSTSDFGAALQDEINEAHNQSWEAGQQNIRPPIAVADGAPRNLRWGPNVIWRTNLDKVKTGTVQGAYMPLHLPVNGSPMDAHMAKAEIALDRIAQTPDVVQGVSDDPDKRKEPLGRSQMRLDAAARGLGRMMVRHGNAMAYGFNAGLEMARVEIGGNLDIEELAHDQVVPEVGQLDLSIDLESPVKLTAPSISSFVGRELEFAKVLSFAGSLFEFFPQFPLTNPRGALELQRRMAEASNVRNIDAILEADEDSGIGIEQLAEVA